jgi:hypothetical protein
VGFGCCGDSSGEEQLRQDLREVSRFGEGCGLFSMGLG